MKNELLHRTYFTIFILSILLTFSVSSCKDDNLPPDSENPEIPDSVLLINNFIHDNMDFAYFWNDKMPDLDPKKQPDPKEYFDALLYKEIDRWSFITDDYKALLDYFSGKRKSVGYSFRLYRLSASSNDVVGFIEYVNPNTPADTAGLKRNDMFFEINGTKLTTENYQDLLGLDSFTLTLGELNDDLTITPLSPKVDLIAEVLTIDPILLDTVIEHAGEKIGYLVYNSFVANYDNELEEVFGRFKDAGVNDLILDLRYNSGGSVNTAVLMASMIAPNSAIGKLLLKNSFNENLTNYFKEKYPNDESVFADSLISTDNNLDLPRYVALTSFKTASASEMVIYTLMPYMNVIQIGEQTHGKYYASITLSDQHKKHNWAIQPIVMRAENADNSIDYSQGLLPEERLQLREGYKYQLGDPKERFLAQALYELTGVWPEGTSAELKAETQPLFDNKYIEESGEINLKYILHKDVKTPLTKL